MRPAPECRFEPSGHAKFADSSVIQAGVAAATLEGTQVTLPVPLAVELWGVAADKADPSPTTAPLSVTVRPEADLAAAAAHKPPSIWGPLLSGLGSIGIAGGGRGGGFAGFNYPAAYAPPDIVIRSAEGGRRERN